MSGSGNDIIAGLRKEILSLGGLRSVCENITDRINLGNISRAFPNAHFPLGAVHEFLSADAEGYASTIGFIATIVSQLMKKGSLAIWIRSTRFIFLLLWQHLELNRIGFYLLISQRTVISYG